MSTQPNPPTTPVPDPPTVGNSSVGDAAMSPLQNPAFWAAAGTVIADIVILLVPSLAPHADQLVLIVTTLGAIVTASHAAVHVKNS